jgi:hypothetical protein
LILSRGRPSPSTSSQPIFQRSILILSAHLRLWSPSFFLHSCYMPRKFHTPLIDHSHYTWRKVQIMKLLVMQFSPPFRRFIPLRSKISSSAPCSQTPSVYISPLMSETKYHTHTEPEANSICLPLVLVALCEVVPMVRVIHLLGLATQLPLLFTCWVPVTFPQFP